MKTPAFMIAVAGLLFLFTLIFGLSLSNNLSQNDPRASGKPLAGALPAMHKLAALATLIIVALTIRNLHRGMEFRGVEWTAVFITGLLFLLMLVSGTLLSLGKAANEAVQAVHRLVAVLTTVLTSSSIYLLTRAKWR